MDIKSNPSRKNRFTTGYILKQTYENILRIRWMPIQDQSLIFIFSVEGGGVVVPTPMGVGLEGGGRCPRVGMAHTILNKLNDRLPLILK